jgi:excisionase family DNA binding protein
MSILISKRTPSSGQEATTKTKPQAKRKEFYTVADLATRWNLSQRHVRRLIEQGEIPVHRIGRAVRISMANAAVFEARCADI